MVLATMVRLLLLVSKRANGYISLYYENCQSLEARGAENNRLLLEWVKGGKGIYAGSTEDSGMPYHPFVEYTYFALSDFDHGALNNEDDSGIFAR